MAFASLEAAPVDAQIARGAEPLASRPAISPVATTTAAAGHRQRIAIVIGNSDYSHAAELPNAREDARAMARLLRDVGFSVFEGHDVDRIAFETVVRTAMLNIDQGADVVFFFAGHGIQIGRRNYLLPIDAAFASIYDLPIEAMTLDRLISAFASRGATHVAIIDACRENPFPNLRLAGDLDANLFEAESGFTVFTTPLNSMVAFSTSPGQVALDGIAGANSPYTDAVVSVTRGAPNENILTLFSLVRARVYEATEGRQIPWESSTLLRPFRFLEPTTAATLQTTQLPLERASPPAEEPVARATDLTLALNREIIIDPWVEVSRIPTAENPRLVRAPERGQIILESDGGAAILYRPALEERPASGLDSFKHEDSFVLEIGPEGSRDELTIRLSLEADPCDLQAGDALDLQGVGLYRLPNEIIVQDALAACADAALREPDTARFHYQLGRAQQAAGQFEQAMESFVVAARAGHIRALHAQAFLLVTPRLDRDLVAIPRDVARADALLEEAIAEGDAFAIHSRGQRLLRDGSSDAERRRGFDLLNRAVELGHTYSMNELGIYFLSATGNHSQPERGLRYLNASSSRDDIYGHHNLGIVALQGLGGAVSDFALARSYFERAAAGGHPGAPSTLGRMIMRGQLGEIDPAAAVAWYDQGLARGDGWGGANAAALILRGDVPGLEAADAAVRAAKATHLPESEAAQVASETLTRLDLKVLNRALQKILVELGEPLAIDGVVGPATRAALERARLRVGLPAAANTGLDNLLLAAKIYWAERPTRPDLY